MLVVVAWLFAVLAGRDNDRWREELAELKKAMPQDQAKIEAGEARIKELAKESREAAGRAEAIENAVYDLKAVNPNRTDEEDTRTPAELFNIIEAKGKEVAEAIAALRAL